MPLEFRPKLDKILELLLYMASVRPNADKYQAVKFFYLADKEHLSRYGRPITYETYFALEYGPVASSVMDFLNQSEVLMQRAGIKELPFETETVNRNGKSPLLYIRRPKRDVDFEVFSKSDLKVFDEIIAKYGDKTFDELYELTHDHYAYKRAWGQRGAARASQMRYEDMVESPDLRAKLLADVGPVAANI